jgi:UDP-glucose 4-epimerase
MKAVVTGGAGFVGSHLTEYLIADGHEVVILDNLSTGRLSNVHRVADSENLRIVNGDICDRDVVEATVAGSDVVFHLAAAVGTFMIRDHPMDSIRTNVYGTENVLHAADVHGHDFSLRPRAKFMG